ncbi:MAG: hypothetical protein WC813_02655 [Patescibacteria group bacterium]|jgi:hypothetical protein
MLVRSPKGVVLLYTMLVMGSASLLALTILAHGSMGGFIDANHEVATLQVRSSVMGCTDEFIIQLKKNSGYAPATIPVGTATCTLTVTANGTTRSGLIKLTQNNITRGVRVDMETSPFSVTQVTETLQ